MEGKSIMPMEITYLFGRGREETQEDEIMCEGASRVG
jgi:hypothetical protein